eukprot:SAG31_NODE_32266_length_357_cov_6.453488_1_plen_81_part_01
MPARRLMMVRYSEMAQLLLFFAGGTPMHAAAGRFRARAAPPLVAVHHLTCDHSVGCFLLLLCQLLLDCKSWGGYVAEETYY